MSAGEPSSHHRAVKAGSYPPTPIIILTCTGSGADRLLAEMSAFPNLARTSGTGILPLCHNAVTTWRGVDGHAGDALSALAAASVRRLCTGLITAIVARESGIRWCELSTAPPAAAETFLRLYPQTRFLIAYRRAEPLVRAVLNASPWGLAGPEFAPFVSAYPASAVAALACYWVAHTAPLLAFEHERQESCLRVRMEDMHEDASQVLRNISRFLRQGTMPVAPEASWKREGSRPASDGLAAPAPGIPLAQIPPPLQARINELHGCLGYPRLAGECG